MQNLKSRPSVKPILKEARDKKNWTLDSKEPLRRASKLLDPNWKEEDYFYPGVSHESWKFFLYGTRKIKVDIFKAYCQVLELELEWKEVAELTEIQETDLPVVSPEKAHPSIPNQNFVGREGAIAHPSQAQKHQSFALPEKIAPVRNWVGRSREIDTLKSQILDPETRAITITAVCLVGLAGIGKTTLASKLIRELQTENAPFAVAAWEILKSATGRAPRFNNIMDSLLLTISNGDITPTVTILDDYHQKTDRLVKLLKQKPCLVVLDNVETVLQTGQAKRAGYFADECTEYAWLFQQIAETEHQSKVMFTSRETLAALSGRETQTLPLGGLDRQAALQLLESFNLIASPEELAELANRYDGHPKALKIVAALILNEAEYQGSVGKFLQDVNWLLVNSLDELIDQVIQRLSDEELMCLSQISCCTFKL